MSVTLFAETTMLELQTAVTVTTSGGTQTAWGRFSHSRHSCGVLKLRAASAAFANAPVGVVMLRPRQRFMCYLCDNEALISDSVVAASATRGFMIQHLKESLRTKHQK